MGKPQRSVLALLSFAACLFPASGQSGTGPQLCREPAEVGLVLGRQGSEIVVVEEQRLVASRGIRVGDRVEQINGLAVHACADVDRALASARRHAVAVLVLLDRRGEKVPVLLKLAARSGEAASRAPEQPAAAHLLAPRLPARPQPDTLPGATAALAAILEVEKAALLHGSAAAYSRRLRQAEDTSRGLAAAGSDSAGQVAAFVAQILEYHRAAERMWALKREKAAALRYDRRARGRPLPYFRRSEVESWLRRYPALRSSVVSEPRQVSLVVPGEGAGLWDADRALEIMWGMARKARRELEEWLAGASPSGRAR